METLSALLALCEGSDGLLHKGPLMRSSYLSPCKQEQAIQQSSELTVIWDHGVTSQ